jgi:hypothetical protein
MYLYPWRCPRAARLVGETLKRPRCRFNVIADEGHYLFAFPVTSNVNSILDSTIKGVLIMSRVAGDKNLSLREQRFKAEKEAEKAENAALKARLKAEKLRSNRLRKFVFRLGA